MTEIEFGTIYFSEKHEAVLRSILDEFEAQTRVHVNLEYFPMQDLRSEYNHIAQYGHGPDVSDIGSTWVSDMANMNALRPFAPAELARIAQPGEIFDAAWGPARMIGDARTWAVPWRGDSIFIHYRRDWLQQAGIDEATAFRSLADLNQTAQKLRGAGIDVPVELSYHRNRDRFNLFHALSGWIWGNGGEFCTPDGRQVLFDQPPAMEAISGYLGLMRSLTPDGARLMREASPFLFDQGKAAIQFWGYHSRYSLVGREPRKTVIPDVKQNWWGVPYPHQSPFGGQYLIVWKHTPHDREAVELVRHLTSLPVQQELYRQFGDQPSKLGALDKEMFEQDLLLRISVDATRKGGRPYLTVPLWSLIESRLLNALGQMQERLLSEPTCDVEELVQQTIPPVAQKLNLTLSTR